MPQPRGRKPKWHANAERRTTEELQGIHRRLTPSERSMAISIGKQRAKTGRDLTSKEYRELARKYESAVKPYK